MLEQYSARGERRRIKLGIISAITAVNLKKDGSSPEEQPQYENGGRKVLEDLADPEKMIHQVNPSLMERHKEIIEKARFTYPDFESRDYLLELLTLV